MITSTNSAENLNRLAELSKEYDHLVSDTIDEPSTHKNTIAILSN